MSGNTIGKLFAVTTFGESHGPVMWCVVDGCPPGIPLTEAYIQPFMDKRRPGQSKFVTQRQEPDAVKILSGVFKDERMKAQVTTGTPIGLLIENVDQRSKDYSDIRDKFRPVEVGACVPPPPANLVDPRPNRPKVLHSADVSVDRNGIVYCTDFSAGLYIMEYLG